MEIARVRGTCKTSFFLLISNNNVVLQLHRVSSSSSRHVSTSLIATSADAPCHATRVARNVRRHRPRQTSPTCLPHLCLLLQVDHPRSLFISAARLSKQLWSRATSRPSSFSQSMSISWNGSQSMVRHLSFLFLFDNSDGSV